MPGGRPRRGLQAQWLAGREPQGGQAGATAMPVWDCIIPRRKEAAVREPVNQRGVCTNIAGGAPRAPARPDVLGLLRPVPRRRHRASSLALALHPPGAENCTS